MSYSNSLDIFLMSNFFIFFVFAVILIKGDVLFFGTKYLYMSLFVFFFTFISFSIVIILWDMSIVLFIFSFIKSFSVKFKTKFKESNVQTKSENRMGETSNE